MTTRRKLFFIKIIKKKSKKLGKGAAVCLFLILGPVDMGPKHMQSRDSNLTNFRLYSKLRVRFSTNLSAKKV